MRARVVVAALLLNACSAEPDVGEFARLPSGIVARVGAWGLPVASVESAAPLGAAFVERWIDGAGVALHMQKSQPSAMRAVARATLSRAFMESWAERQMKHAPPTDQEVNAAVEKAWLELRRPRAVRFGELFLSVLPVESDELARSKLEQVRERALGAESTVAWAQQATEAASALGLTISARMWPPVAANGRIVPMALGDNPNESVPPELVRAASSLQEPGDKSPVVGAKDGYHLLIAHEVFPERGIPSGDLPHATRPLVAADRGGRELAELRVALRKRTPVVLAENRASLLQTVWRKR